MITNSDVKDKFCRFSRGFTFVVIKCLNLNMCRMCEEVDVCHVVNSQTKPINQVNKVHARLKELNLTIEITMQEFKAKIDVV